MGARAHGQKYSFEYVRLWLPPRRAAACPRGRAAAGRAGARGGGGEGRGAPLTVRVPQERYMRVAPAWFAYLLHGGGAPVWFAGLWHWVLGNNSLATKVIASASPPPFPPALNPLPRRRHSRRLRAPPPQRGVPSRRAAPAPWGRRPPPPRPARHGLRRAAADSDGASVGAPRTRTRLAVGRGGEPRAARRRRCLASRHHPRARRGDPPRVLIFAIGRRLAPAVAGWRRPPPAAVARRPRNGRWRRRRRRRGWGRRWRWRRCHRRGRVLPASRRGIGAAAPQPSSRTPRSTLDAPTTAASRRPTAGHDSRWTSPHSASAWSSASGTAAAAAPPLRPRHPHPVPCANAPAATAVSRDDAAAAAQ